MAAENHNEKSNRETIYKPGQSSALHKVHNSLMLTSNCHITLKVSIWTSRVKIHLRVKKTSKNCNLFCNKDMTVQVLGEPEEDDPKEYILFSPEKKVRMEKMWCEVSSNLEYKYTEDIDFNVLKVGKYKEEDGSEHSVGMISFLCSSSSSSGRKKTHVWVASHEFDVFFTQEQQQQQVIQTGILQGFQVIYVPQWIADIIQVNPFLN